MAVVSSQNPLVQGIGLTSAADKFDLAEISLHNGIEHDASLTRRSYILVP
jgi:hypothetical protein